MWTVLHSTQFLDIAKVAVPVTVGALSFAYMASRLLSAKFSSVSGLQPPVVELKDGAVSHDAEYGADPVAFLSNCRTHYGPVFTILLAGQTLVVVNGGDMIKEVLMNPVFSFKDALDELTGVNSYLSSMIKSNDDIDSKTIHEVIRDGVVPNLASYTPRIVDEFIARLDKYFDDEDGLTEPKTMDHPMLMIQEIVAGAMVSVFMGPELARNKSVLDTYINCTMDFAMMIGAGGSREKGSWTSLFLNRVTHKVASPMTKHIQNLTQAAKPLVAERERLEKEAGQGYHRPDDILQKLIDKKDQYGFVDLEDIAGNILIMVLASVHTTTDATTNVCYYLAAFPEYHEELYQEVVQVLEQEANEPNHQHLQQRDLWASALKKMVKLDSFVREVFRYRSQGLTLQHKARKDVLLSTGVVIPKARSIIVDVHSAHYGDDQGAEPNEFRPWRFVGRSKSATQTGKDFLSFGMGKRACPGRQLAVQEVKMMCAMMVMRFVKLELQNPEVRNAAIRTKEGSMQITGLKFSKRLHGQDSKMRLYMQNEAETRRSVEP